MEASHLAELQAIDDNSPICRYCLKLFKNNQIRKRHEIIHTDKALACHLCGKRFVQKSHYKEHLEKVHNNTAYPVPPIASVEIEVKPLDIIPRIKQKNNIGTYDCKFCSKSFKTSQICARHERIHTNPFICDYCHKEFGSKSHMKDHLLLHTQMKDPHQRLKKGRNDSFKKNVDTFKCSDCKKHFYSKSDLRKHEKRIHLLEVKQDTNLEKLMKMFNADEEHIFEQDLCLQYPTEIIIKQEEDSFHFEDYQDLACDTAEINESGFYKCGCNQTFSTFTALARHESINHPNTFKESVAAMRDLLTQLLAEIKPDDDEFPDNFEVPDMPDISANESIDKYEVDEKPPRVATPKNKRPYSISKRKLNNLQDLISQNVYVECKVCTHLISALEYENHLQSDHPAEDRKMAKAELTQFFCGCCNEIFETAYLCIKHLQRVDHQLTGSCCDVCTLEFQDLISLNEHRSSVHLGGRPMCEKCAKTFKNNRLLRFHMLRHKGLKPAYCKLCGSKFLTKKELDDHLLVHNEEPELICAECGLAFKGRERLRQHIKNKHVRYRKVNLPDGITDLEEIVCTECGQLCKGKDRLKRHIYKVHTKRELNHECNHCGKRFDCKSELAKHVVCHVKDPQFFCNICGSGFTRKQTLNRHIRVHDDTTKTLSCTFCSKTFRSTSNLKRHLICHTGEKNQICPECSSAYADRSCLNKHMEKHHNMSLPGYNKMTK